MKDNISTHKDCLIEQEGEKFYVWPNCFSYPVSEEFMRLLDLIAQASRIDATFLYVEMNHEELERFKKNY